MEQLEVDVEGLLRSIEVLGTDDVLDAHMKHEELGELVSAFVGDTVAAVDQRLSLLEGKMEHAADEDRREIATEIAECGVQLDTLRAHFIEALDPTKARLAGAKHAARLLERANLEKAKAQFFSSIPTAAQLQSQSVVWRNRPRIDINDSSTSERLLATSQLEQLHMEIRQENELEGGHFSSPGGSMNLSPAVCIEQISVTEFNLQAVPPENHKRPFPWWLIATFAGICVTLVATSLAVAFTSCEMALQDGAMGVTIAAVFLMLSVLFVMHANAARVYYSFPRREPEEGEDDPLLNALSAAGSLFPWLNPLIPSLIILGGIQILAILLARFRCST